MPSILHRLGIHAPLPKVYSALSTIAGVSNWWTEETSGDEHIGGKIQFLFRDDDGGVKGKMRAEIKELKPSTRVCWQCIEGPAEWIGTDITFDLSEQDGQTIVIFGHRNWKEEGEFMSHCSMKWATFLLSLREYVETGKGKPAPRDLKIDNWN